MAGAYAAVVTLMHTIEQIQHHPRPPISLDTNQVQSLTQKLTFLQEFLEDYSHGLDTYHLAEGLVRRIADAAHAVEDKIESRVVDQIRSGSADAEFEKCLQKVVDDMDIIKREVMEIKETITPVQVPLPMRVIRSSSAEQNIMVGFDDPFAEIMNKLIDSDEQRLIIPIVGMGGMGKTTLARHVYNKLSRSQHFDVCAWTTISNFNFREFSIDVLSQVSKVDEEKLCKMSDDDLKKTLHQQLFGRRYLIVMDDIWSVKVWDDVKLFLPDCEKRSRVVATTRLSSFASNNVYCLKMKFLDDDQSWTLFCKVVFGEEVCPRELEEIGKKIAKCCKGLPLSISVIGGLLVKSKYEVKHWGQVAANLNSVVNLENDKECSKILDMSYRQLPIHLKPCFLHVGVYLEHEKIRVSRLIELWAAEGFLKPICGKGMEVVAQEYFNELVDRNLILVGELGAAGNIKYCGVHDLLKDFCLREAKKERFCSVLTLEQHNHSVPENSHRRVVIPESRDERYDQDALGSTHLARSLYHLSRKSPPTLLNFPLLRIYRIGEQIYRISLKDMFQLVNLRYFDLQLKFQTGLDTLFDSFWNLSTVIMKDGYLSDSYSFPIWKMPHLRHLRTARVFLQDPYCGDGVDGNDMILGNLETLSTVINFKCSEEMIKRLPNIKKLNTSYSMFLTGGRESCDFLNNIEQLRTLESLVVSLGTNFPRSFRNLSFPNSLKKLSIGIFWEEDHMEEISLLPHLVKLKLMGVIFKQNEWVTVEGRFPSLRFLQLKDLDLHSWKSKSSHFPRLQRLTLERVRGLKEIPSDIGDIPTLESIHVIACSDSAVISARKIKEKQEEFGDQSLQVQVQVQVEIGIPLVFENNIATLTIKNRTYIIHQM